jgi:acyl carrier protein
MSDQRTEDTELWVVHTCHDLGLHMEGADADFFEEGGTSLTAIRLIARVEAEFGEDALPPEDFFEASTVRDIAATITANRSLPRKGA